MSLSLAQPEPEPGRAGKGGQAMKEGGASLEGGRELREGGEWSQPWVHGKGSAGSR